MPLWLIILLIAFGVLLVIGIIRVIVKRPTDFGELMLDIFCIDVFLDILEGIIDAWD